jgi:hypothetical protein
MGSPLLVCAQRGKGRTQRASSLADIASLRAQGRARSKTQVASLKIASVPLSARKGRKSAGRSSQEDVARRQAFLPTSAGWVEGQQTIVPPCTERLLPSSPPLHFLVAYRSFAASRGVACPPLQTTLASAEGWGAQRRGVRERGRVARALRRGRGGERSGREWEALAGERRHGWLL